MVYICIYWVSSNDNFYFVNIFICLVAPKLGNICSSWGFLRSFGGLLRTPVLSGEKLTRVRETQSGSRGQESHDLG